MRKGASRVKVVKEKGTGAKLRWRDGDLEKAGADTSSWQHAAEQFQSDCRKFPGCPKISDLAASAGGIFWTAHLYSFPQAREFSGFSFPMVPLEAIIFHLDFVSWNIFFLFLMAGAGWGVRVVVFFNWIKSIKNAEVKVEYQCVIPESACCTSI